jgi:hypothetical protein
MEKCTERALRRDGHKTLLIDDKRAARLIGRKLTQRWALSRAWTFKPDFVFLGKCHGLNVATVAEIIQGKPNDVVPRSQWYKAPIAQYRTSSPSENDDFFVSGFEAE